MNKKINETGQSLEIYNSNDLQKLAIELQEYCKQLNLVVTIQGKHYPLVEAWQFAGHRLGLRPQVVSVIDLSNDKEKKYRTEVSLINKDGTIIGSGVATCSNLEKNKKYFEEYAICSMAQTRAIGKAYRNTLSWVMKSAGYEPTPAEEMDFLTDNFKKFKNDLLEAKTIGELEVIWNSHKKLLYNFSDTEKKEITELKNLIKQTINENE